MISRFQISLFRARNTFSRQLASYSSTTNIKNYDITVVGGGIAGSSLVCALGSSALFRNTKIALVDSGSLTKISNWDPPTDSFSNRTVQITSANQSFLSDIGVWDNVYKERVQPYSKVVLTDMLGGEILHFNTNPGAEFGKFPAYLVENVNLHQGCLKTISEINKKEKRIDIVEGIKVDSIKQGSQEADNFSDYPIINLSDGTAIKTRLLIGSDGMNSIVKKFANIDTYGHDYNQFGSVANLCFDRVNETAYQRFLPTGPIVILPLPNGFANLVWSMDTDVYNKTKNLSDENFVKLVNAALRLTSFSDFEYLLSLILPDGSLKNNIDILEESEWRIRNSTESSGFNESKGYSNPELSPPKIIQITKGSRQGFPLKLRNSDKYYSDRIALVGDAAHTMHPLAGQGLNAGLTDVITLVEILGNAVRLGIDIGSTENVLAEYNNKRYLSNTAFQGGVDKLWHIFRSKNPIITTARGFGMKTLNQFPIIKEFMVKNAMF
ncbi:hypothetical protein BB559_006215 [Furculomyces boomerangus]|uniref:Ubiquinone biosynthesis monooxygenase COQ6, mitochondrial n=1 Tax=Furculomyces boomerangus TaxID=61424 RepID=A0A2T9Y486_9FUNG|nr:hypothetical protein BB559_006215 [Furculomyces boomerangus]